MRSKTAEKASQNRSIVECKLACWQEIPRANDYLACVWSSLKVPGSQTAAKKLFSMESVHKKAKFSKFAPKLHLRSSTMGETKVIHLDMIDVSIWHSTSQRVHLSHFQQDSSISRQLRRILLTKRQSTSNCWFPRLWLNSTWLSRENVLWPWLRCQNEVVHATEFV